MVKRANLTVKPQLKSAKGKVKPRKHKATLLADDVKRTCVPLYKDANVIIFEQLPESEVPESLYKINQSNSFEAMLHPVDRDYFFANVYQKKAMILRANPKNKLQRLEHVIDEEMFGLNAKKMLANTASDMLHIWYPPKGMSKAKKMTISNVDTDDIAEALSAYK